MCHFPVGGIVKKNELVLSLSLSLSLYTTFTWPSHKINPHRHVKITHYGFSISPLKKKKQQLKHTNLYNILQFEIATDKLIRVHVIQI